MPALGFRPLLRDDLALLHAWLRRPHVRRWWNERDSYDEVVARYAPAIDGADPTDLYLALLDGEPVGFVQTYLVADYPEYAALVGTEAGAAGVDLFVADEARTGKGLGTELLRRFVEEIVFATRSTTHCVADPEVENVASIRAFEKAGFHVVRTFVDPGDGTRHALVRRDR